MKIRFYFFSKNINFTIFKHILKILCRFVPTMYKKLAFVKNKILKFIFLVFLFQLIIGWNCFGQQHEIDSLEKVLKTYGTVDTNKVNTLNKLCWLYRYVDAKKALDYGNEALNIAIKFEYKKGMAKAYNNLGVVYFLNSKYLKSIECHKEALKIRRELNDKLGIANSLNNLSINYSELTDFKNALDYAFQNLKILEELKDNNGLAKAYNNIGLIYYKQSYDGRANIIDAIEYYGKALKLREEMQDKEGIASTLYNLGQAYSFKVNRMSINNQKYDSLKGYDSVLIYFNRSLSISEITGNLIMQAKNYTAIGSTYGEKGQYKEALMQYDKSLAISNKSDYKGEIVALLYNIASIKVKQKKYAEGLDYYNKSLKLAQDIEFKDFIKANFKDIAETYYNMGNFKDAYLTFKAFSGIKDSIYTKEASDFQNNTVSQYESDKKQQEIKLLNQENDLKQQKLKNNNIIIGAGAVGIFLLLMLSGVILKGYRQKQKTNILLEVKNTEIEKKNKDITDSIKYAQRIQKAILPANDYVKKLLPEHFIIYLPKDIVSGDFYWVESKNDKVLFSAVDCTGHGVPGAFMSIVGRNLLNQAVNEYNITKPSEILNYLNNGVIETFKHSQGKNDKNSDVKDGMDLALCCLSNNFTKIEYAGAYNPLYLIRNNEVIHYKADVYPIGTPFNEKLKTFTNTEIALNKGDTIYVFSDGYVDQFGGGAVRKKYTSKRFRETLLEIQELSMEQQKNKLIKAFEDWKGNTNQIDDVLIIGIRV